MSLAKLTIINVDQLVAHDHRTTKPIIAQYNPRELAIEQSATWAAAPTNKGDHPELTFGGGSGRSISVELFFDTFESGDDVHKTYVAPLQQLLLVMSSTKGESMQRPPRVTLVWGEDLPRINAVVASVSVKYTMFLPWGRPVRATCAVKFTEAVRSKRHKDW